VFFYYPATDIEKKKKIPREFTQGKKREQLHRLEKKEKEKEEDDDAPIPEIYSIPLSQSDVETRKAPFTKPPISPQSLNHIGARISNDKKFVPTRAACL
jgi:hypothetical protein